MSCPAHHCIHGLAFVGIGSYFHTAQHVLPMHIPSRAHLLCTSLLAAATACAQQNTVAGGGEAAGSGGSVSYSVGQVDHLHLDAAAGSVSQGVQQPFNITVITGVEVHAVDLLIGVHPNPAHAQVVLVVTPEALKGHRWALRDDLGRELAAGAISSERTTIPLEAFAAAGYLLQVSNAVGTIKTYRIIKT